ncbi:hypothetical protein DACRYDRAFT_57082 [Dacryopinax primogenitus]|uniref:Uncharacterized protein n=1 Tax=Dacryopinax primogenitus (strain DJM 731) TaxID=1858805 RepID=M5FYQ2_DACPD|nr:uncharacterized protein DACRYDRAFT_57082 [Dacryopinax primogenitus]EJT98671.1 hypothetical protein DACRYDRAFT_57082 [Dacryopinax primogenitus]
MVQNQSKGMQKKAVSRKPDASHTKKGKRVIAPKKKDAVKHDQLKKSLSSKINRSIEKQIVGAAGNSKLTIVRNEVS